MVQNNLRCDRLFFLKNTLSPCALTAWKSGCHVLAVKKPPIPHPPPCVVCKTKQICALPPAGGWARRHADLYAEGSWCGLPHPASQGCAAREGVGMGVWWGGESSPPPGGGRPLGAPWRTTGGGSPAAWTPAMRCATSSGTTPRAGLDPHTDPNGPCGRMSSEGLKNTSRDRLPDTRLLFCI